MIFRPTWWLRNVLEIDRDFIEKKHLRGLILDLDNTLSMHGSPAAEKGVYEWLGEMRSCGMKMIVVSNNTEQRVKPLAQELGLDFISFGCKPLTGGISKAVKAMRLPKKEIAIVGDQIFTDVLGGNLGGVRTILVEPFYPEEKLGFKIKRKLENVVFNRNAAHFSKYREKNEKHK